MAFAVLGACSSDAAPSTSASTSTAAGATSATGEATTQGSDESGAATTTSEGTEASADGLLWEQVSFGSVSAYLLLRGREIALVDTGNAGQSEDVLAGLEALGASWSDLRHVILTHSHPDHIGGLFGVLENAPQAVSYAGVADLPAIANGFDGADQIVGLSDGDDVFGLQVIGTPGHTVGHISVFDPDTGVLVAGDALIGSDGGLSGASPRFSTDIEEADASVRRLADGGGIDTVLMGHGTPVVGGAASLLVDLAAGS